MRDQHENIEPLSSNNLRINLFLCSMDDFSRTRKTSLGMDLYFYFWNILFLRTSNIY